MDRKTSYCPELPAETVILEEGEKVLFLVPSRPDWLVTNKNVAELLRLCNGQNTKQDIYKMIQGHGQAPEAMRILHKLIDDGFFDEDAPESQFTATNAVNSIHLNMTADCNLQCIYCYAEERNAPDRNKMTYAEYISLIDCIHNLNDRAVITFTGGEPLLNADTIPVAAYCKSKGLATFLLTNALAINKNNVLKIAQLFDTIRISVDGCSPATHDKHRGAGSYRKVMGALKLLEAHGADPLIAMTVTKWNVHEIQGMAERFGNRLTFQPLYEVGKARQRGLGLSGVQYFEALRGASGVEPYGRIAQRLASMKKRGCGRCAIGEGEISVSPSGDVYPCHMLHVSQFCAGNIREQAFDEIYSDSKVLKDIRKLSVNTRTECRECPVRLLCSGGCWARAFYAHGDLNAADDFCDYEILAFKEGLLRSEF
ncbi:radical SAM protein [Desulfovibrio sp. OttesenSCG-928-G11]|nr:radical SAM protein [Desulfovibrio sp. OttesenSCG-928-G11]